MRTMPWFLSVAVVLLTSAGAAAAAAPEPAVLHALAPTGKLRVGLYLGAPASIVRGATLADSKGVGFELGRELARRLNVPYEPVAYAGPGAVVDALKAGEWDIALLAVTPARQALVSFTTPMLAIEHGFMVTSASPITSIDAVDKPGMRIGAPSGGSVNVALKNTIKFATVVPSASLQAGGHMLAAGKVDAYAANKSNLFELRDTLPGARVLAGRIGVDNIAIALPKERAAAGIPYLQAFVDDAKIADLVKAAAQRAALRGLADQ